MNIQLSFLIIISLLCIQSCVSTFQDGSQPPASYSTQACLESGHILCGISEENCWFQYKSSGCAGQRCVPKGECTQRGGEVGGSYYPFVPSKQTQNATCKADQELCLRYDSKIKKYIAVCVDQGNCPEKNIQLDK